MDEQGHTLIDIATRDVTCLFEGETLGEAARIMEQRRFSSIVVVDEALHPVGIVTERNILNAMREQVPVQTPLRDSMSAPVITLPETTGCVEAYQSCLRAGIRHLVTVGADGVVTGLVSETDFRKHLHLTVLAGRRQVMAVAKHAIATLTRNSSLKQALDLMQAQHESCVLVVEEGKPVGIVTERDIVGFYAREPGRIDAPLSGLMASPVLSITDDATINEAARSMTRRKVRHLAVVDRHGFLLGLVSEHDLTQIMATGLLEERFEIDELFLRTFIDTIPDLVWLKDKDGVILSCNRSFAEMLGTSVAAVIGKRDMDFVDENKAKFFRERDLQVMATGQSCAYEESLKFVNGYQGLFETIKTSMRDNRGNLIGVLGVARDITEREHIKRVLAESEQEFRALAENLPDNIIRYDRDCRVRYMNPAMARTIAPDLLPIVGRLPYESAPESLQLRGLQGLVEQVMDTGERVEVEFEILHPDHSLHWHHVVFVPERDPGGTVTGALGIGRDISERKRADAALQRSLDEYSELVQRIPVGVYKYRMGADGSLRFEYVSPRWCELLDVDEAEVMRDQGAAMARIHPDEFERFHRTNEDARRRLGPFIWEGRIQRRNGEVRWLHIESQPSKLEDGDILWEGIQYDVTDRRQAEDALRITASVFDNSQEAIVITDDRNTIMDVNKAFSRITGYAREEVLGRNPRFLSSGRQDKPFYEAMWHSINETNEWRGEIWNRRKNGEVYAEQLSISAIRDAAGRVQRHVGVFSDITHFKDYEAELSMVANYDPLTGIPNRRLLADRLRQSIAHALRAGKMLAICYIDLDGFKEINDRFGHEGGDRLLVSVTHRLHEVLRGADTLARLGGDEFVVLLNELEDHDECVQVLDRIMQMIGQPVHLDAQPVMVSASIGVTLFPEDREDGDTLLRHADQAMYVAKQSGKNRYHFYDSVRDQRVRTLHESRRRILLGLERDEFELYYQPKLNLASGKVCGVEALIRWHHPEQGLLTPGDFLPLVESSELEITLGRWVMRTALTQLQVWEQAGIKLNVSINVSAHHLQSPEFVADIRRELARCQIQGQGRVQIEVLETAALEDTGQSFEVLLACKQLGVSCALDDFGTGYSSLVYLRKLGADTLKIDQTFVQHMAENDSDRTIVQGVIALAKAFNLKTVAEGVEDPRLLQALREMGCDAAQGFGIAHPMSVAMLAPWLDEYSARVSA